VTDADAIDRARDRFRREADRVRAQVKDAEAEAQRVEEATKVDAAGNADEAARQVGEIRARLDQDLTALEARLPPRHVLATQVRVVGGAAAAGVALLTVAGLVLRRRSEARAHERDLRIQAAEIARFLPGAVDPDADDGSGGEGGRSKAILGLLGLLAAGAAAGYAALRSLREDDDGTADGTIPPG
jgi:hypothetical protein